MKNKHVTDFNSFVNENYSTPKEYWGYGKNDELINLIIEYPNVKKAPSKNLVIKDMNNIISRFREGTEYANFNPKSMIVYPYVYGWDSGYKAYISISDDADGQFTDENTQSRRGFWDEVDGKAFEYKL